MSNMRDDADRCLFDYSCIVGEDDCQDWYDCRQQAQRVIRLLNGLKAIEAIASGGYDCEAGEVVMEDILNEITDTIKQAGNI